MLTGNSSDADQILGFDSGANDYITKPFNFAVLLARIRVHLRQHEQSEDAVFAIGPYVFKPSGKILFSQMGSKIHLTEKETLMLKLLYGASGNEMNKVYGCSLLQANIILTVETGPVDDLQASDWLWVTTGRFTGTSNRATPHCGAIRSSSSRVRIRYSQRQQM